MLKESVELLFKVVAGDPPKTYKVFTNGLTEGFDKPVLISNHYRTILNQRINALKISLNKE